VASSSSSYTRGSPLCSTLIPSSVIPPLVATRRMISSNPDSLLVSSQAVPIRVCRTRYSARTGGIPSFLTAAAAYSCIIVANRAGAQLVRSV
jgi:hypothetical protein